MVCFLLTLVVFPAIDVYFFFFLVRKGCYIQPTREKKEIISVGEYLEPDFEPTSLTVSQLLGVLSYHNIDYPTPYTKPKLIQVFNSEIKTRATKFKKERLKKENSIASDEGIKDGITGELINKGRVCVLIAP